MSFLEHFHMGNLVLPSGLLFHYHDLFDNSDDFLVWQFFYLQNTTNLNDLAPSQIANAVGKSVTEINQVISRLTQRGLLDTKTIELDGEIELIFDASPTLAKLDQLTQESTKEQAEPQEIGNDFKILVGDFERELGRYLSPFELEDLQKTVDEDRTDPAIIRLALKEAVLNNKVNFKYINAILRNWRKERLTTVRQVQERLAQREQPQKELEVSDAFRSAMDLWAED